MRSRSTGFVARLAVLLALVAPSLAVPPAAAQEPDAYFGFTLDGLAESLAHFSALRTQHGEKGGDDAFADWLARRGSFRASYEKAYAAWWERFDADLTGQLEARFHRINAEYSQRLHFADASDRRQEVREGVSLETYARIAATLTTSPDADVDAVLRAHGVRDQKHWQRVNEAWAAAMKADTSLALVQQYGAMFQKHAGQDFVAAQERQVAESLAAHRRAPSPPRTSPSALPTIDQHVARLDSAAPAERWEAAREVARLCDLWMIGRQSDDPRARHCTPATLQGKLAPVIVDALDHHDDDTIHYATGYFGFLGDLGLKTPEMKMAVGRALHRAESRLATLESAFRPIQDKAVPERVILRTRVDEYTATVEQLSRELERW